MLTPRWFIAVLLLIAAQLETVAQKDTGYLKALYDRALDFDESKLDSLLYYADFIEKTGAEINFPAAKVPVHKKGNATRYRTCSPGCAVHQYCCKP